MAIRILAAACLLLAGAGCAERGLLYTRITAPYSTNFAGTPVGSKQAAVNTHRIREPISRFSVSGEWDTDEIIKAARRAGMRDIHYIDLKTISVLRGLYRRQTFIVYGD
jgi:hypothetical protein